MISASYYLNQLGLTKVIRISSEWSEESSGFQDEHTQEIIACMDGGKYFLIQAHLETKTTGGEYFEIVSKKEISEQEYQKYLTNSRGIIDAEKYKETCDEIFALRKEIEKSYPSCPRCGALMKERSSQRGIFLGCSSYPNCNGTIKINSSSGKIKTLRNKLIELNKKVMALENG